jgi:hypothetical protein
MEGRINTITGVALTLIMNSITEYSGLVNVPDRGAVSVQAFDF